MAEGAQLPWKVQKIDESRGPPADYSCLTKPLPPPPSGVEWRRDETTREWYLVRVDEEGDRDRRRYRLEVGTAWDRRAGREAPTLVPVPIPREELGLRLGLPAAAAEKRSKRGGGGSGSGEGVSSSSSEGTVTPPSQSGSEEAAEGTPPAVEGVDFLIHTVLPTDTLPGLCLRYRLKPTALRRLNRFSGSNLRLAPSRLIVPLGPDGEGLNGGAVLAQDRSTPEFKLHAFLADFPHLRQSEGRAYLEMAGWDLAEATKSAREDDLWERTEGKAVAREEEEARASGEVDVELRADGLALDEEEGEDGEGGTTVGCWGGERPAASRAVLDVHVAVPAAGIELVEADSNGGGTRTAPDAKNREEMVPAPPAIGGGAGDDGGDLRAPLLRKIELPRIS